MGEDVYRLRAIMYEALHKEAMRALDERESAVYHAMNRLRAVLQQAGNDEERKGQVA